MAPTCRSNKPTRRSSFPKKGLRPELAEVLEPGPVEWKKTVPWGNTDLPQAGAFRPTGSRSGLSEHREHSVVEEFQVGATLRPKGGLGLQCLLAV